MVLTSKPEHLKHCTNLLNTSRSTTFVFENGLGLAHSKLYPYMTAEVVNHIIEHNIRLPSDRKSYTTVTSIL